MAEIAGTGTDPFASSRLWGRGEVLTRPCPVPASSGVYAWYFQGLEELVPQAGRHRRNSLTLMYVGISSRAASTNGASPHRQTLRSRIRYHYRGNAEGSTLRLTLGCLLADQIGLRLRRVGSGTRMTFTHEGEERLSAWMATNAFVAWQETEEPWHVESRLIADIPLPLNLDQNSRHPFHIHLSSLRRAVRYQARLEPVFEKT